MSRTSAELRLRRQREEARKAAKRALDEQRSRWRRLQAAWEAHRRHHKLMVKAYGSEHFPIDAGVFGAAVPNEAAALSTRCGEAERQLERQRSDLRAQRQQAKSAKLRASLPSSADLAERMGTASADDANQQAMERIVARFQALDDPDEKGIKAVDRLARQFAGAEESERKEIVDRARQVVASTRRRAAQARRAGAKADQEAQAREQHLNRVWAELSVCESAEAETLLTQIQDHLYDEDSELPTDFDDQVDAVLGHQRSLNRRRELEELQADRARIAELLVEAFDEDEQFEVSEGLTDLLANGQSGYVASRDTPGHGLRLTLYTNGDLTVDSVASDLVDVVVDFEATWCDTASARIYQRVREQGVEVNERSMLRSDTVQIVAAERLPAVYYLRDDEEEDVYGDGKEGGQAGTMEIGRP